MRALALALTVIPALAYADHDHHGMDMSAEPTDASSFNASVALVAASYDPSQSDNMFYGGSYEGVKVGVGWTEGRFGVGAGWAYYRLLRNGSTGYGFGDAMASGQVTLVSNDRGAAGLVAMVSLPTGEELTGIGMGHAMAMPALWGSWRQDVVQLIGSAGYSFAMFAPAGHVHGMAPLVDPMNMYEVSWSGGADYLASHDVRVGGRLSGGIPVGSQPGTDRIIAAGRVAWQRKPADVGAEVQYGLLGDPFSIRVVVSTAITF